MAVFVNSSAGRGRTIKHNRWRAARWEGKWRRFLCFNHSQAGSELYVNSMILPVAMDFDNDSDCAASGISASDGAGDDFRRVYR